VRDSLEKLDRHGEVIACSVSERRTRQLDELRA
jgi:hypothetical protein